MDKKKIALLLALSVLLVFLAAGTVWTAFEVVRGEYDVAGDGVSLIMLLAFLTYADSELVLFLREKFEGEEKGSTARGVVLIYLVMAALLIVVGIICFSGSRNEEVESLGEGGPYSIPPEMDEEILLPQIPILDDYISSSPQAEEEYVPKETKDDSLPMNDEVEKESISEDWVSHGDDEKIQDSDVVTEEESGESDIVGKTMASDKSKAEESDESEVLMTSSEDIDTTGEAMTPQVSEIDEPDGSEVLMPSSEDEAGVEEMKGETEEVRVPSAPMMYYIPRLYEVEPPSAPEFLTEPSSFLYEPYEQPKWEDDDFWSSFYIAGETELELIEGIYYFDLYVNENYSGQITTYIDSENNLSIATEELKEYTSSLLTDDAMLRIFNYEGEYMSSEELRARGVSCTYDTAAYTVSLTFDNIDMPVQIISIRGSSSRYVYRPIAGAEILEPAVFTLTTRHSLSGSATVTPTSSFVPSLYLAYSASNSFRLFDLYGNFSLYASYTPGSFNFRFGSYSFYYDFPDYALRLSFGNISTDLLSVNGTSVGIRLDKSLSYASESYREKSYIEEYLVIEKISDVQILNEGREIFRRTLQPGNYRLQDFILYSGANAIDIIVTPLDGTEPMERHFNVNYNSGLVTPGDFYYGIALATGRNISSNKSSTRYTLSIPYFSGRYLEYNPLNLAASAYIQAGFGEGVSFSGTIAANNRPSGDVLFIPSFRISSELTHVNVLGTTRYNVSFYENAESDGSLRVPYVYARIGHQVSTGVRWLSSVNLSIGYTSPTNYEALPGRHYLQGSLSLSGSIYGLGWSLNGSTSFYTDAVEDATYSLSGSLSYALGRNLFLSASMGLSGVYTGASNMYGQISASLRFGRTSASITASNSAYSANFNTSAGRHSVSASLRTMNLAELEDYSMRASYSYSGSLFNFNASYNAYDVFDRSNLNFNLSTSSLFADGLFVMAGYVPNNFLLIRQEGVLKGNELTVGNVGSSASRALETSFGTAIYPSISSRGESLSIFSVDPDSFGTTSTFNVSIPPSRRSGYVMRIDSESKYSLSSLVTLPDGTLWRDGSSPVYACERGEGGNITLMSTEYYIFSDQDGRFIANDLLPGTYAFDVPYGGSWILYMFTVEDNREEYGNIMMYEPDSVFTENTGDLPHLYAYSSHLTITDYMSGDEFWEFLYPAVWEDVV